VRFAGGAIGLPANQYGSRTPHIQDALRREAGQQAPWARAREGIASAPTAQPASTVPLSSACRARLLVGLSGLMRMAVILLRFLRRISNR
jgi:hypothetical protein